MIRSTSAVIVFILSLNSVTGRYAEPNINNTRIVGGQTASPGQFPHQVSLRFRGGHVCGGSIISPNWILTAAHCVSNGYFPDKVLAGTIQVSGSGGIFYRVAQLIPHEQYDPHNNYMHDIGLVSLAESISFDNNASPIQLASSPPSPGTQCILSGFGYIHGDGPGASVLQYLNVGVVGLEECNRHWGGIITRAQMCTYNSPGKGACSGDSGGPTICNGEQHGVVSYVYGKCAKGLPDVHSKVYEYRSWISSHTGI